MSKLNSICGAVALAGFLSCTTAQDTTNTAAGFFGLDKLWDVHLIVAPEKWDAMYPKDGFEMGLGGNSQFSYQPADVWIAGHLVKNVGIRFKGNKTYQATSGTLKRPIKIDFNRFEKKKRFLGLRKLNLQSNAEDPAQIREAVALEAFRSAGVPAPRTAFGRVYLTINERISHEYIGFYTLTEQVDLDFMAHNFGVRGGLITKPTGEILRYSGDKWNAEYDEFHVPKSKVRKQEADPLIGLTRLIAKADAEEFEQRIADYLDVDEFLRYLAVSSILANWDSPFYIPHNIYLVVPPKLRRVVWVPWDLNLALGSFIPGNRTDQAVKNPSESPLVKKVLDIPRYRELYEGHLRKIIQTCCSAASLKADIAAVMELVGGAIESEDTRSEAVTKATNDPDYVEASPRSDERNKGRPNPLDYLIEFVELRERHVVSQLDGRSEGTPMAGFPPARPGRATSLRDLVARSGVLEIDESTTLSRAEVLDAVAASFDVIDRDSSGQIDGSEILEETKLRLTANLRRKAIDLKWVGLISRRNIRLLDDDDDGAVARTEWMARFGQSIDSWDRDKSETWTFVELKATRLAPHRARWRGDDGAETPRVQGRRGR